MSQISGTARCFFFEKKGFRVVRGLGSVKWLGWVKGGDFCVLVGFKALRVGWIWVRCSDNLAKMKMSGFAPLYVPT